MRKLFDVILDALCVLLAAIWCIGIAHLGISEFFKLIIELIP